MPHVDTYPASYTPAYFSSQVLRTQFAISHMLLHGRF